MAKIIHQTDLQQFICVEEGLEAKLRYRHLDETTIDAFSTFVPPELRSQGIADKLASAFFKWCTEQGYRIQPSCRYIEKWLLRNSNR
ncbi:MAG: GNAT family N-acetyltransferase [Vibrionaceae bacterium]